MWSALFALTVLSRREAEKELERVERELDAKSLGAGASCQTAKTRERQSRTTSDQKRLTTVPHLHIKSKNQQEVKH
tara:strand:+ start:1797 stop:2024 length:228 start_codon:yes stop_codon:yes gene_type:complete